MKIICGTDFSPHANEAANVAAATTARLKGTLSLVHVLDVSRHEMPSRESMQKLCDNRRSKLAIEAERLSKPGLKIEQQFLAGSPAVELVKAATKSAAHLIVVSSLGHIAPSRWLVGSVAERTAQNASVTTLVVRKQKPLLAWARGKRTLKVMVACDFSESGAAALRWTMRLKKFGPCRITVAYVAWLPDLRGRFASAPTKSDSSETEKLLKRELQEKCAKLPGIDIDELKFCVATGLGRPDPQLIEMAGEQNADLVVVGTNQRRGLARLGSVSRAILHHSPLNVACVPIAAAPGKSSRSQSK